MPGMQACCGMKSLNKYGVETNWRCHSNQSVKITNIWQWQWRREYLFTVIWDNSALQIFKRTHTDQKGRMIWFDVFFPLALEYKYYIVVISLPSVLSEMTIDAFCPCEPGAIMSRNLSRFPRFAWIPTICPLLRNLVCLPNSYLARNRTTMQQLFYIRLVYIYAFVVYFHIFFSPLEVNCFALGTNHHHVVFKLSLFLTLFDIFSGPNDHPPTHSEC